MKNLTKGQYLELMNADAEDEYQVSSFNAPNGEIFKCEIFITGDKKQAALTVWEESSEPFYVSGSFYDDANLAIANFKKSFEQAMKDWSF